MSISPEQPINCGPIYSERRYTLFLGFSLQPSVPRQWTLNAFVVLGEAKRTFSRSFFLSATGPSSPLFLRNALFGEKISLFWDFQLEGSLPLEVLPDAPL